MSRREPTTAPDTGGTDRASATDAQPAGPPGAHRYRLSPAESAQAHALASALADEYGRVDHPAFLADVSVIAHDLPRGLRLAVNRARLDDRKHGLVVSGNPVDQDVLGPTPSRWQEADTGASRAHSFLIMLYGSLLGEVIAWATQQDGRLVTDVVPTPGMEESLVSSSSSKELGWHTEDAFSPYRADYVGLLCLRSPELTATTLGHLDPAAMPAEVMEVLNQPRFHIVPDASHDALLNSAAAADGRAEAFRRLDEVRRRPPLIPLVTGHPDAPVLRIDSDYVAPGDGDEAAAYALKWLVDHLDGHLYDFPLAPGDMGFIDNRNVVHGRRPFRPRYDGTDRWLKRINVVVDFRRTRPGRADTATRVIG
ncbi:guanitoxin biosynthesis L-enduracididine beta-hydroxylase GntD [Streptomyces sp. NRRL S-87]|uniref:guanitoxin biosynthesis L-enduracididine beta-hydroxylase GntD n=1 Tax=Streptomyces sp. NRRL S-87 TaxID=1463920 RepID=UPI000689F099|nr:guanitoxin biosynthesis L-enduracididine beta-hydroxylase GntD [Streptomyces sp. NRRL S-87]